MYFSPFLKLLSWPATPKKMAKKGKSRNKQSRRNESTKQNIVMPKLPVTIATRRQSQSPAVFLLASFTDPAWEPVELDVKPLAASDPPEFEFSKAFDLPEGSKYQYRFRLGAGDDSSYFCDKDVDTGEYPIP